jgi:hypothetical protein
LHWQAAAAAELANANDGFADENLDYDTMEVIIYRMFYV